MTIGTEFESITVCRQITELRFKGGWSESLKKYSMEDDGELSRISAMRGHDIARSEKRLKKFGQRPPIVAEDTYQYTNYYIYAMEYQPHKLEAINVGSPPNWLIWHNPLIFETSHIYVSNLTVAKIKFNPLRPTLDFNHEPKNP